jgi:Ser/Thr protein kinase RdoA (MazF antagonist)
VASILGAPVARAVRIYGGYAPSATFRLLLRDGRRAFFKGSYPTTTGAKWSIPAEERVYRRLGRRISPWAPEFLGASERDGWHVLLLEDLGPADVPPWTAGRLRAAARDYAAFHAANMGARLPRWVDGRVADWLAGHWPGVFPTLHRVAALAGRRSDEALEWLDVAYPVLRDSAERARHARGRRTLLHFDTRSDNVRVTMGRLRIFDWNFAASGPPEFDAAAFAQSITAEGGPPPERFTSAYREVLDLREGLVAASAAAISGYFADRAWQPEIEGLPRLRRSQRRQLVASLSWAARLLDLPEPSWLRAVRV